MRTDIILTRTTKLISNFANSAIRYLRFYYYQRADTSAGRQFVSMVTVRTIVNASELMYVDKDLCLKLLFLNNVIYENEDPTREGNLIRFWLY